MRGSSCRRPMPRASSTTCLPKHWRDSISRSRGNSATRWVCRRCSGNPAAIAEQSARPIMAARWNKKLQYRSQQNQCSIPTAAFRSAWNAPGHRTFLKSRKASPMKRMIIAALLVPALALTAACASLSPQDYSAREARSVEAVQYGSVVSVRPVRINGGDQAPVGTLAGAAVGGLLGSTIGHGGGSAAGAILGAVGGGLAGNAIERNGTAQNGEEVVVRLDNGQTIAVVQGGWQDFAAGQRVQVVTGSGGSPVRHALPDSQAPAPDGAAPGCARRARRAT